MWKRDKDSDRRIIEERLSRLEQKVFPQPPEPPGPIARMLLVSNGIKPKHVDQFWMDIPQVAKLSPSDQFTLKRYYESWKEKRKND